MKSDLHIHTLYSDGVFSPEKIVDTAIDVGLQAIALTDHDNVLSYPVAKEYLKKQVEKINLKSFKVLRLTHFTKITKFIFWDILWMLITVIFKIC